MGYMDFYSSFTRALFCKQLMNIDALSTSVMVKKR